ncbi:MAG: hypothetical protein IT288_11575 [Bdellovibrionales bacterium]|nr:hypothetical protein [Bdellovibrionales bacterium]
MNKTKLKPAVKGGAKKAAEDFEKDRKKEPSDRLVKIIAEYDIPMPEKTPSKDDQAAKDAEI